MIYSSRSCINLSAQRRASHIDTSWLLLTKSLRIETIMEAVTCSGFKVLHTLKNVPALCTLSSASRLQNQRSKNCQKFANSRNNLSTSAGLGQSNHANVSRLSNKNKFTLGGNAPLHIKALEFKNRIALCDINGSFTYEEIYRRWVKTTRICILHCTYLLHETSFELLMNSS